MFVRTRDGPIDRAIYLRRKPAMQKIHHPSDQAIFVARIHPGGLRDNRVKGNTIESLHCKVALR